MNTEKNHNRASAGFASGLLLIILIGCGEVKHSHTVSPVLQTKSETDTPIFEPLFKVLASQQSQINSLQSELSETRKANADQEQRLINIESYLLRGQKDNNEQNFKDFVEEVK